MRASAGGCGFLNKQRENRTFQAFSAARSREKLHAFLERVVGIDERSPHVGDRAAVETQPFPWLPEAPPDDVDEGIEAHLHILVEGVEIVDGDQARLPVPFVPARLLVRRPDVRLRLIAFSEDLDIALRVLVPGSRVGEEAYRL